MMAVLIIFSVILQTVINLIMLCIGRQGSRVIKNYNSSNSEITDWGGGMSAACRTRVQLFAGMHSGWPAAQARR